MICQPNPNLISPLGCLVPRPQRLLTNHMQLHLQHNAWTDGGFRVLGKRCGFLRAGWRRRSGSPDAIARCTRTIETTAHDGNEPCEHTTSHIQIALRHGGLRVSQLCLLKTPLSNTFQALA